MKTVAKLLLLLVLAGVLDSCASKKRREDASVLGKFYHNTTAKFNAYYNADVLLTSNIQKLGDQHQDNFNKILPVFPYLAAQNATAVNPDLDNAIKKVSLDIALHRQSHWVDDCYLLMGQCQYLKKDFETSEETLKFLLDEYPADGKKVKKGKSARTAKSKKEVKQDEKERKEVREKTKKEKQKEIKQKQKDRKKLQRDRKKAKKSTSKSKEKAPTGEKITTAPPVNTSDPKASETNRKKEEQTAKDEKKTENPPSYFLRHRPAHQMGQLWYAKTLIEREKFESARRILTQLETNPHTFQDVRRDVEPTLAYAELKQRKYDQAIPYLEKAIALSKDKFQKARYSFIIAQLHQRAGRSAEAYQYFQQVLKFKPAYEMEFNTRLLMAQNSWATGKSTPEQAQMVLNKMLKEDKNLEFKGQIYYALAQVAAQAGNRDEAIKNLLLAVENTTNNQALKADAFYQLAKMYLQDEKYVEARTYFENALQAMDKTDERYAEVDKYSNNLREIAENFQVIILQDSLLRISKMTPEEKKALAIELKKRQEEERIKIAQASAKAATVPAGGQPNFTKVPLGKNPTLPVAGKPGLDLPSVGRQPAFGNVAVNTFFAYDEKALRRGKREFEKKWGIRPLVDYWRLESKIESQDAVSANEQKVEAKDTRTVSDEELQSILADVPSSAGDIATANKAIEDALFQLGKLFREKLQDFKKSAQMLEELMRRYPATEYKCEAWYYTYLAYNDLGNTTKSQDFSGKILENCAESVFARVIKNPNFYKESLDKNRQLTEYYDQTYLLFTQGNYKQAFDRASESDNLHGSNNPLRAKFALLRAMCLANLQGREPYINALKEVVAKYPQTPEQTRAREILRLLGDESQSVTIDDGENTQPAAPANSGTSQFKMEENDLHYIIVVLTEDADLGKAKSDIGDYHRQFHSLDNLKISNVYLGDDTSKTPLIVIRRFKDKTEAMRYYDGTIKNKSSFMSLQFKFQVFAVSQNNYRELLKQRGLGDYSRFFKENYQK